MMFDNSPPPSQPRAESVKRHIPVVLAVLGVLALAVGIHTATSALVVIALGHLAVAGAIVGVGRLWEGRNQ